MLEIKVGYCLAYDWELLKVSLPLVYPYADKICLSIDKERISWAGNRFLFDEVAFQKFIKEIDTDRKLFVYEDDFHQSTISPMENEVSQRNKMAEALGKDTGWHIQLDVDEYPIDVKYFVDFLKNSSQRFNKDINICLPWLTLFKQVDGGFLIAKTQTEWIQIATTKPFYVHGRRNGYFNYRVDCQLLHQSWARSEDEIRTKINNWGHKNDFDTGGFFRFWQNINEQNFREIKNFHPEKPRIWRSLKFVKANDVTELLSSKQVLEGLKSYSKLELLLSNSRTISKIKQILNF